MLQILLGGIGDGSQLKSPFSCDYGRHVRIGRNGFINYGCVFLDRNSITIGDDAQIGPECTFTQGCTISILIFDEAVSKLLNPSPLGTTFG